MKKIIILITSLFFISQISSMDKDIMRSMNDNRRRTFLWNDLILDMKKEIIKSYIKSLILTRKFDEDTQKSINDLKFTNKEIYNFINDPFLVKNLTAEINKEYNYPIFLFTVAKFLLSKEDYKKFQESFTKHLSLLRLRDLKIEGSEREIEILQRLILNNIQETLESNIGRNHNSILFKIYECSYHTYLMMTTFNALIVYGGEEVLKEPEIFKKFEKILADHKAFVTDVNVKLLQLIQEYRDNGESLYFKSDNEKELAVIDRIALLTDLKDEVREKLKDKIANLTFVNIHTDLLNSAIRNNDYDSIIIFLKAGEKITNYDKENLLLSAVSAGRFDIVQYLTTPHNINYSNFYGETPLMIALNNHHSEIAKFLINQGADINLHDYLGNTALIIALRNRQLEMVKLFLAKKAITTPVFRTFGPNAHTLIKQWYYDAVKNNDLETQLLFSPYLSFIEISALGVLPNTKCVIS